MTLLTMAVIDEQFVNTTVERAVTDGDEFWSELHAIYGRRGSKVWKLQVEHMERHLQQMYTYPLKEAYKRTLVNGGSQEIYGVEVNRAVQESRFALQKTLLIYHSALVNHMNRLIQQDLFEPSDIELVL